MSISVQAAMGKTERRADQGADDHLGAPRAQRHRDLISRQRWPDVINNLGPPGALSLALSDRET